MRAGFVLFLLFVCSILSPDVFAKEYEHKLPAGGVVVIAPSEWDTHKVICTAEPQDPKVLTQTCTCTSRYIYDRYYFVLVQDTLLSNGKIVNLPLADRILTLNECNTLKKEEYSKVCSVR